MGDAVELKVCIRCRPFGHKDKLGVLISTRKDAGEMKLVNLEQEREMSVGRYAFNNTWWSAPNFEKFLTNDDRHLEECKTLKVITQEDVYGIWKREEKRVCKLQIDNGSLLMRRYR